MAKMADLMPRRGKKRRKIEAEDGSDQGWEEYFDYIFPEDEAAKPNLKLLAMAKMWKKKKDNEPEENDDERIQIEESSDTVKSNTEENTENLDADDQDIVNESSSDSEDEEDARNPKSNVKNNESKDSSDEGDAKRQKLE